MTAQQALDASRYTPVVLRLAYSAELSRDLVAHPECGGYSSLADGEGVANVQGKDWHIDLIGLSQ